MHALLPSAGRYYYYHSISTYDVHVHTCVVFVEFQRKERREKRSSKQQHHKQQNNKTIKQK